MMFRFLPDRGVTGWMCLCQNFDKKGQDGHTSNLRLPGATGKKGGLYRSIVYHQPQPQPKFGSIMSSPYRLVSGANWKLTAGQPKPNAMLHAPPRPQPQPEHACTVTVDITAAAIPAPVTINFLITRKYLLPSDGELSGAFNVIEELIKKTDNQP